MSSIPATDIQITLKGSSRGFAANEAEQARYSYTPELIDTSLTLETSL